MIDNYDQTMKLMEQMKAHLPIPVYPDHGLLQSLQDHGIRIKSRRTLHIQAVHYMGDEGGIMCALSGIGDDEKTVNLCSLTHLRVKQRHPLARAMKAYQRARTRKLAQQPGYGQASSFTVFPERDSPEP